MTKRRRFTAEFKARVALDALRGDKTIQEIAAIKSYGQLAQASPDDVRKILGKFAGGADVEDWIAQAKELAKRTNA